MNSFPFLVENFVPVQCLLSAKKNDAWSFEGDKKLPSQTNTIVFPSLPFFPTLSHLLSLSRNRKTQLITRTHLILIFYLDYSMSQCLVILVPEMEKDAYHRRLTRSWVLFRSLKLLKLKFSLQLDYTKVSWGNQILKWANSSVKKH